MQIPEEIDAHLSNTHTKWTTFDKLTSLDESHSVPCTERTPNYEIFGRVSNKHGFIVDGFKLLTGV